jgi:hypothetical protein
MKAIRLKFLSLCLIFHLLLLCYPIKFFAQAPVINFIQPMSANIGSVITITGNNFNPTANNNAVFFGGTKAQVVSSAPTILNVKVPKGAQFQQISVTNVINGLTGFSSIPFNPTFPKGDNYFSDSSYEQIRFYPTFSPEMNNIKVEDLDEDGKPEVVLLNGNRFSIFRNKSSLSNIVLSDSIDYPLINSFATSLTIFDCNGDGKKDIVMTGYTLVNPNSQIFIYKNLSTPNNINFSIAQEIIMPQFTDGQIQVADFDNDGKIDMVTKNGSVKLNLFKNSSSLSNINFENPFTIDSAANTIDLKDFKIADLDGDKKPDIVISRYISGKLLILKNISTNTISFATPIEINTGNLSNPGYLDFGDLDGDTKPDIVVSNGSNYDQLILYKNNSATGSLSFNVMQYYVNQFIPSFVAINDLNGDGRLDMVDIIESGTDNIGIINNRRQNCFSLFEPRKRINTLGSLGNITVADLNGDGKPEILNIATGFSISVLKNNIRQVFKSCPNSITSINAYITGSSYQWQQNNGTGFVNIVNNVNFSGTNTPVLTVSNPNLTWDNYKYRCIVDNDTSNFFTNSVKTNYIPAIKVNATTCPINTCLSPILVEANYDNEGDNPLFQWQDSTSTHTWANINGENNDSLLYNPTSNISYLRCLLTSSLVCATPQTQTSDYILINFSTTSIVPTINISSSANSICAGTAVTFTATSTNGGTAPIYQWQVNGSNVGTNSNTFTSSTLNNNDQVKCILTSNAACATPNIVSSNIINMIVSASGVPAVTISTANTTVCAGSNITFTATPAYGGSSPSYQWQVNGINTGTNSNIFTTNSLTNGSVVKVIMTSSASCASQPTATSNAITINISSVIPTVNISASSNNICPGANVMFTATTTNGGTTPVYQWKKNGINTGTNSNTYSSNTLLNGDVISVSLTSNAACANPATVNSNNISITVNSVTPATISINGVTTVSPGASTLISSVVSNGGSSPAYQWQDSTSTHTWQNISGATSSSVNYSPASTGNKLKCIFTANNPCLTNNGVTSNVLTFTVTPGFAGPTFYPNPVSNYLVVDGLKYRDSWESVHIVTMSGAKIITVPDLTGLTRVVINMEGLPSGIYICVLSSRFGYAEYYKFVKL